MNQEPNLNLEAIELEEARLRERLAKLAVFKQLAQELQIPLSVPANSTGPLPTTSAVVDAKPLSFEFDGTFAGLVHCYRTDERSPYRQLKHNVRNNYDALFNRLIEDVGDELVGDWNAQRIRNVYDSSWAANGKLHMGHSMVGKLRLLCTYGSTTLNNDACIRLSAILGNMRFQIPRSSAEPLTAEHARAIREKAHASQLGSIALAQAFQFDIQQLRQMDVIGEWVPLSEPGTSDITKGKEKWLRGLRWSEINQEQMTLRRMQTSGRQNQQRELVVDLKDCPMIMEELNRIPPWNRLGPMIVNEKTRLPWIGSEFRRKWRQVADAAGVPKAVKNAESGRAQDSLSPNQRSSDVFG
ncbi:hypothetical protein [Bradyrhizobium sp.]|uniref:hypothetical protein n=1 Tax=Bradyrhizobium sp. TaxID=376 RepID=UPI004037B765